MAAVFAPPQRSSSPTRRLAVAGTPLLSASSSSAPSPADAPDAPPVAGQRAAYALCFVLGFGALLPWNSVVNNLAYFIAEYQSDTISFFMSAAYTAPQLPVLVDSMVLERGDAYFT